MESNSQNKEFLQDILKGLSSNPKYILSKYFYDAKGSKIFQDIMQMPEYYLTDCELEIFKTQQNQILNDFKDGPDGFDVLELGAGDGMKTKVLLKYFVDKKAKFTYSPVDISSTVINKLIQDLEKEIPDLHVEGLKGDYFKMISSFKDKISKRKIILFLGSNIGNLSWEQSLDFLIKLRTSMNKNDRLFIGFDLKKDKNLILEAYNDANGHTAAFNLNLLHRINRELDANFKEDNFYHEEFYDAKSGRAESFLISKINQSAKFNKQNKTFTFAKGEKIFTEMSQKFDLSMIEKLAENTGFKIVRNYFDKRQYFMNSLWRLKS